MHNLSAIQLNCTKSRNAHTIQLISFKIIKSSLQSGKNKYIHTDLHGSFQAQFGVNPRQPTSQGKDTQIKITSSKGVSICYDVSNQLQCKDNSHKVGNKIEQQANK